MKKIVLMLAFGCFFQGFSQSSVNAGGGDASAGGASVAYAVGQTFYQPYTSASGSVNPGVEHSYEILETLGVDVREIGLSLKIYPNPTANILFLSVDFSDFKKYTYELSDNAGRIISSDAVSNAKVSVPMATYPSGIYFLTVKKAGKAVKSFKVIKTDR